MKTLHPSDTRDRTRAIQLPGPQYKETRRYRAYQNRGILKRLIDIMCHLGMTELTLCGYSESEDSIDTGNYIEFIYLFIY